MQCIGILHKYEVDFKILLRNIVGKMEDGTSNVMKNSHDGTKVLKQRKRRGYNWTKNCYEALEVSWQQQVHPIS